MAAEGLRRLHGPAGLVPVRAGLVIDFCTSPIQTGNSTYQGHQYQRTDGLVGTGLTPYIAHSPNINTSKYRSGNRGASLVKEHSCTETLLTQLQCELSFLLHGR